MNDLQLEDFRLDSLRLYDLRQEDLGLDDVQLNNWQLNDARKLDEILVDGRFANSQSFDCQRIDVLPVHWQVLDAHLTFSQLMVGQLLVVGMQKLSEPRKSTLPLRDLLLDELSVEEYHPSVRAGRLAKQLRDLGLAFSTLAYAVALASNGPPVSSTVLS